MTQHTGSPVRQRVAMDEEVRHLRRNLEDAPVAAQLYQQLDEPDLLPDVPRQRGHRPELRTDAGRYLAAEALLAARAIAAGPRGPALAPAVESLMREVLRAVRRLDDRPDGAAWAATPVGSTTSRHAWLVEQVAALRVTAYRSDDAGSDDGARRL